MTTYTIIVQNNHGQDGSYAIFNSPPQVTTNTSTPNVFTNTWLSQFIPDGGNTTVNTTTTFYAWSGTTPSAPSPGVTVQTGSAKVAQLGMGGLPGSTFPMTVTQGVPVLGSPLLTAGQGAYEIDTDTSFPTPNTKYMVGLGKVSPITGVVSPVASMLADNNSIITITPIMKFYVATSAYKAGQIVNFQTATKVAGLVDFSSGSGLGMNTAVVTHDQFGNFTTTYLSQGQTVLALKAASDNMLSNWVSRLYMPQTNGDNKLQLENVMGTLAAIINSYSDNKQASAMTIPRWIGKVAWPAVISFGIAATGATYIHAALIQNGYAATMSHKTTSAGTEFTWSITPPSGPSGARAVATSAEDVTEHWNKSVAADTQDDQHKNEGVQPEASLVANEAQTNGHGSIGNGEEVDNDDNNLDKRFSKFQLKAIAA